MLVRVTVWTLMVGALWILGVASAAQAQSAEVLRTASGAPDLQGVWDFRSLTPMERPQGLAEDEVFTDEQAAEFSADAIRRRSRDSSTSDRAARVASGDIIPYNDFWFDEGTAVTTQRTSLVVDPADGRIPPLTPAAGARAAAAERARSGVSSHEPTPGGFVEDLGPGGLQVRCILGFNSGPPMTPSAYNNNVQVFQTDDAVVLLAEMNHNVRVIPLTGNAHVAASIRQWTGDARGRWEGDTLVVETTNFLRETNFMQGVTSPDLTLVERFTRIDADTLRYDVTVADSQVWTAPWTFSVPMTRNPQPMYEYACHEGNYGLYNILAGATSGAGK
ncbi:MAG: hypothetical protein O3A25_03685 [Acidobacteria bacterium]|nr:hypothetical protein [Acidobacteriota bacterium]